MSSVWQCPTCSKIWLKVIGTDAPLCTIDGTALAKVNVDSTQVSNILPPPGAEDNSPSLPLADPPPDDPPPTEEKPPDDPPVEQGL